jgi:pilus assembly protein CpaB
MLLALANRPVDGSTTFSTGGDVSRFQRRTVPAREPTEAERAAGAVATVMRGPTGPTVRIARGNNVTVVPVGAR